MNANVIRFGSIGKWALYPSKIMPRHPDLKERDLLGGTIDLAHRNGIKIIVYIPISHALPTEIVWKKKPEWAFVGDGGKFVEPVKHFGGLEIVPTCMNGKYHEDILGIVREIINNYEPDGIYLDGPYQGWAHHKTICQCKSCRDLYFSETGLKLPPNKTPDGKCVMNTPEGGRYLSWINAKLANILSEIRDITKSKKDIPLIINRTAVKITGLDNERAMIKLIDGFLTETDAGGIEGFSYGAIHKKVVWNYTTQHRWWPRLSSIRLEQESALEAYRTMSMCSTPIVAYAGRYFYGQENSGYMKTVFSRMRKLEGALSGTEPAKFAAVLFPGGKAQATVDFHALMKINPDAYEIYKCLHSNGIQAMVLPDYFMEEDKSPLISFKIICVPSSLPVSDKLAGQLDKFVKSGGTLLVSGSRRDGFGDRESKLEALLGIKVLKGKCEERRLMEDLRWLDKAYEFYLQAKDEFKYGETLMTQCDFIPVRPKKGSKVLAETVCWPKGEKRFPAVIARKTGRGQTIYFNSSVEDLLSNYGQVEFRELVGLLLKNSRNDIPFEVKSEKPISATLVEKNGFKIVHVLNEQNLADKVGFSIFVKIPSKTRGVSARSLVAGNNLKFKRQIDGIFISNLTVSDYECLSLELEN